MQAGCSGGSGGCGGPPRRERRAYATDVEGIYAVEAESAGMRTEDVMDGCGRRIVDVVTSTDGGYE